jgi:hypothetical protein
MDVVVAEPVAEVAEEAEVANEDYPARAATRPFSRLTAACLLLAILSLLGVYSMTFLKGPVLTLSRFNTTGFHPPVLESSVSALQLILIFSVTAVAVVLAFVGLLVALLTRRFGPPALLTTYPALVLSALLLGILGLLFMGQLGKLAKEEVQWQQKLRMAPGFLSISPGLDVVIPMAAAGAATLLLLVAILLIHRSLWARIVTSVVALLVLALGAGLLFFVRTT